MRLSRLAVVVACAIALARCGTPPGPPPIVDLGTSQCADVPDLVNARPLILPASGGKPVTVSIDGNASCLNLQGGKSLYSAFQLPTVLEPYLVSVASAPAGEGIFSPRMMLLDGHGIPLREIPRDSFVFRGRSLSALFRVRPDEHYLIVASDAATVGQAISRVAEHVTTTTTAGPIYFQVYTGSESTDRLTYSHGGTITVSALPLPGTVPSR